MKSPIPSHSRARTFAAAGAAWVCVLVGDACASSEATHARLTESQVPTSADEPARTTATTGAHTPDRNPVVVTLDTWQAPEMWQPAIDAFEISHPNVVIEVRQSEPADYDRDIADRAVNAGLGDIITCRGFDWSLKYFSAGSFASLTNLEGIDSFSPLDTAAWTTDDGDETFCVPVAAVLHAFAYNPKILAELDIAVPVSAEEFQSALEAIADDGRYVPFAVGIDPRREVSTMLWFVTGAQYWEGEKGRLGLISRAAKLTDEPFVASLRQLEAMGATLATSLPATSRLDALDGFAAGVVAFVPVGSWESGWLGTAPEFEVGIMPAPAGPSGRCYSVEHAYVGLALNSDSENREAAEHFLAWVTTSDFADAFFTETSGFISLRRDAPEPENPTLQKFLAASEGCAATERLTAQMLSRGDIDLTEASGEFVAAVMSGALSAEDAAQQMQHALEKGYGAATN